MKKFKKKEGDISGLVFVGCLFIGIGLGVFYGNTAIGTLIGLGSGFIAMAFFKYLSKKK